MQLRFVSLMEGANVTVLSACDNDTGGCDVGGGCDVCQSGPND